MRATKVQSKSAAIYARISADPNQESASVEMQVKECRELADRLGLTVEGIYPDRAVSAYSGKTRPEFERLLDDVEAGRIGTILIWHPDRLYRRTEDYSRVAKAVGLDVEIRTVTAGEVDLRTASGTLNAGMLALVSEYESAHKAERVRDRAQHRATVERVLVSSMRPFGWRWRKPCGPGPDCRHERKPCPEQCGECPECKRAREACKVPGQRAQVGTRAGLEPDPIQAPALAAAYADMAAGLSLHAAWKRLAASVEVGKMTSATLGTILRNPRNAGLVTYKGRIVGEAADGQRIVDPDLYDKVAAILNDPTRRTTPGRPAGTWLGGGILRCGRCGGPMSASNRHSRSGGGTTKAKVYICSRHLHLTRRRNAVDEAVLPLIADVLAELGARGLLAQAPGDDERAHTLREQIAGHQQTLDGLSTQLATGALHPADYAAATTKVRALMANLQAELSARAERPALAALADAADTRTSWGTLLDTDDHDTVRAVVGELVDVIVANTDRTLTVKWREFTGLEPTVLPPAEPRINGRQARRRKVADLHTQGLSISAIAAQVGCDRSTVRDDLKHAGQ